MIIPEKYSILANQNALIIVSSKEHGIIYQLHDGTLERVEHLEHSEPTRSDDEGFFFKAAAGNNILGGAPKEDDSEVYKKQLNKMIADELRTLLATTSASILYVFEPEHYKGRILEHIPEGSVTTVHTVRYGNYVKETPIQLLEYIDLFISENTTDLDSVDFEKDL